MVFGQFFRKHFIDVIDWVEQPGILAWRYPAGDRSINNGAQLTVREGQKAAFLDEGRMADIFGPGRYVLDTATLPLLTALENWDKGFRSPFKSDIYFFALREQVDRRWGTAQPITVNDESFGPLRIRAHGRYSFTIIDVPLFWAALVDNLERFTLDEIEPQLRAAILTALASKLGEREVAFVDMARDQTVLSEILAKVIKAEFARFGLELTSFLIESLSVPEEVQDAMDTAASSRAAASEDPLKLIERLHALLQAGAISQVDFDTKKAELLGRVN